MLHVPRAKSMTNWASICGLRCNQKENRNTHHTQAPTGIDVEHHLYWEIMTREFKVRGAYTTLFFIDFFSPGIFPSGFIAVWLLGSVKLLGSSAKGSCKLMDLGWIPAAKSNAEFIDS